MNIINYGINARMHILFFALSLLASTLSFASDEVRSISRPLSPNDSREFSYSFRLVNFRGAEEPVIIYIPGGPGQTAMQKRLAGSSFAELNLPLILTDPRGTGRNIPAVELNAEFYNSELVAADIVAMIQSLGLKRYAVYGASYGTVVATEVAAQIEGIPGMAKPSAVILTGTLGQGDSTKEASFDRYMAGWDEMMSLVSPATRAAFSSSPLPLGASGRAWGAWVEGNFIYGQAGINYMVEILNRAAAANTNAFIADELEEVTTALNAAETNSMNEASTRFHVEIACRELWVYEGGTYTDFVINNGALTLVDTNTCANIPQTRRYDSKNYRISAPIYYFDGTRDFNTPFQGALYHLHNHSESNRNFVAVPEAGHCPLMSNLRDCAPGLFAAMLDGRPIDNALASCQAATQLTTLPAETTLLP